MKLETALKEQVIKAVNELYNVQVTDNQVQLQKTRKEFDGDITLVVFPFLSYSKKKPEETGDELGRYLKEKNDWIVGFSCIKGFLNLTISGKTWLNLLYEVYQDTNFGINTSQTGEKEVMVEYSSPNTNKPLHLGHIRNNLLGYAISNLLQATGKKVVKANLVNDRGIHICKSMLAWQKWGRGETPESAGKKGDNLVGDYYVKFDTKQKIQIKKVLENYKNKNIPNNYEKLGKLDLIKLENAFQKIHERLLSLNVEKEPVKAFDTTIKWIGTSKDFNEPVRFILLQRLKKQKAQNYTFSALKLLRKWEENDKQTIELWKTMNNWVYQGFDETYKKLGVDFDKIYYESETYLLGKKIVLQGLDTGKLYKKEDGSVWADLTPEGLDQKLLLRSDGTSVYMTQDIGTAHQRFEEYDLEEIIYVVGNEQNYHFQVLSVIMDKLGYPWAKNIKHLSYGMVELPEGKMKSREGKVVDADDLIEEMITTARQMSSELGKLDGYSDKQAGEVIRVIGLAALKYFILKVDPKKNMTFDPKESIDFNGNTGPFIQYTHARICSLVTKAESIGKKVDIESLENISEIGLKEKELVKNILQFPGIIIDAAETFNPSLVINYVFDLVKEYNQFYHDFPILKAETNEMVKLRLAISEVIGRIIKTGMGLLGIEVPERM